MLKICVIYSNEFNCSISFIEGSLIFAKGKLIFRLSYFAWQIFLKGNNSIFLTQENLSFRLFKNKIFSLLSLIDGIITCLRVVFIFFCCKHSKKESTEDKEHPTFFLYNSSVWYFISSKQKSVTSKSSKTSLFIMLPEVSRQVLILFWWQSEKISFAKSGCSKGSPPERVMPPLLLKYSLNLSILLTISCAEISFPFLSQVSGLWQQQHLKLHPWRKTTYLTPGPSTVPKLCIEFILPIIMLGGRFCL